MTANWVCPRCGKHTNDVPAWSHIDDNTRICSACGTSEAVEVHSNMVPTFATWRFAPLSVWRMAYVGDGVGAGSYVQFLRLTRKCAVFVHSLDQGRDVSIGSVAIFEKLYQRMSPDEEREVLTKFTRATTVNHLR